MDMENNEKAFIEKRQLLTSKHRHKNKEEFLYAHVFWGVAFYGCEP